jgi:phosphomannomutase
VPEDIKFGTDGWRARIAQDYTFDNVRRCTQGFASYLKQNGKSGESIIIGYDRRFQSEFFARASAETMAANGFNILLTDKATPTPIISFSVVNQKAAGAINITASHNPYYDNGFKVRDENGAAIAPDGLEIIQNNIPDSIQQVKDYSKSSSGQITEFDPAPAYIQNISKLVDLEPICQASLDVLVDPMWGNGAGWFPRILSGGKINITEIHAERNPLFPGMQRPEPIPPNIDPGLKELISRGSDVLIINDGDADRIGVGDEHGNFINQLQMYGLLALYFLEVRGVRGPIVKTLSTTSMLNKLGKMYDVPVYETGVGFKYVGPKMMETGAFIGGEESGGYAFRGNVPERDGILAGLFLLDMMIKLERKPSELIELLFEKVGPHYYDRIDRRFTGDRDKREEKITSAKPDSIGGLKVEGIDDSDGFKFQLEDGGWLLIRFSGTEPVMRVYTETTRKDRVSDILQDGLRIAGLE